MTRRLGGFVVSAALAVFVTLSATGCFHLGGNSGASNDAGGVTPSPGANGSEAANASEVARFADEVPFGPTAVVAHDKTRVRKSPGGSDLVSTLASGTDVVKIAARGDQDLVCFDESRGGGRHLMGWIAQSDLEDLTPPSPSSDDGGATPPTPPDPQPPHGGGHHHNKRKKQQPRP